MTGFKVFAVLAAIAVSLFASSALADCGSIPFVAVVLSPIEVIANEATKDGSPELKIDPLKVSVFEPKQRAIILWNGTEEVLLLSTDQKASEKTSVLEVIPLPSEPTVRLSSFKVFEAAQKLVVENRMWACAHGGAKAGAAALPANAGRITFAKKMGAHDLSVATVNSPDGFVEFVQNYLQERYKTPDAPIRPEFVDIIQSYIDEGYRWFAFDVIQMDGTLQSREPIEYRFASDRVHYPLRISSMEKGRTEAELLVFTKSGGREFIGIPANEVKRELPLNIATPDVYALSEGWKDFFGARPDVVLDQWTIEGKSSELTKDIAVK